MITCPLCNSDNAYIKTHPLKRCSETGYVDGGDLLVCDCGTWEMDEVEALIKVPEEVWQH